MAKMPSINASVTEVRASSSTDGWSAAEPPPGALKWSGAAPAHVTEQVLTETGGGVVTQLKILKLVVPTYLDVEADDIVRFVRGGGAETRRVQNLEERSDLGFTRLYLYDL